jgi:hypothetical protein
VPSNGGNPNLSFAASAEIHPAKQSSLHDIVIFLHTGWLKKDICEQNRFLFRHGVPFLQISIYICYYSIKNISELSVQSKGGKK